MAVPAGDQRDWNFAKKFKLEIPNIFKNISVTENAYTEKNATITNSSFLNELNIQDAGRKVIQEITKRKIGSVKIQYKLFSKIKTISRRVHPQLNLILEDHLV